MGDFADDREHDRKQHESTQGHAAEPHAADTQQRDLSHLDRLWTKSALGGQGNAAAATAPQPGQPANDAVLTRWMLNYGAVTGRRKDPSRTSADQLVVDELRIQPDDVTKGPAILHGGNRAKAGRVHLGDAQIAKGPGTVAALVRYEKRSAFDVKVSLDQKATKQERALLAAIDRLATKRVEDATSREGNYDAIASQLEQELASEFPGKALSIQIVPAPAGEGTAAEEASYTADEPGTFEASIDPSSLKEHTNSRTTSVSDEDTSGTARVEGSKTTTEEAQSTKGTEANETSSKFTSMLQEKVGALFKKLEQAVAKTAESDVHENSDLVNWNVGLGQGSDKDGKSGAGAATKTAVGGALNWIWKKIKGGAAWIYKVGKTRVPVVGAVVDFFGSVFDTIYARGTISRGSTRSVKDTRSHSDEHQTTEGTEVSNFDEFATTATNEVLTAHRTEIETMTGTKLGTEVSSGETGTLGEKKSTSTTYSSSTTVTEANRPRIRIRKLG